MTQTHYTPDISEFHVGFEFEQHIDSGLIPKELYEEEQEWKTTILQSTDNIFWISPEVTRVKFLDKEDIESLGFVLMGKSIDLWFERKGIFLREDGYHLKNIKLQYGTHDQKLKLTFHYVAGEEQIHFQGIIKNKSELIRLMKQLQINQ